jgi:glucose/arabinose dehydrogenase/mono/diheme cytochrome c family protein
MQVDFSKLPLVAWAGLLLTTFIPWPSMAAEPPVDFECRWAMTPPVIDGQLDDECWKSAELIDQFRLPWLQEKNRAAKTATRARLLWDQDYLFFAADLDDGDLFADVTEHDGKTWDNDVFELFFKPDLKKTAYYEFQVNAAGTVMDVLMPAREPNSFEKYRKADDFHIHARVQLRGTLNQRDDKDTGWTVEGRIPWLDLVKTGGRPTVNDVWKFALCRYDYDKSFSEPELSTCAPLKSQKYADFHLVEDYANLKFVAAQVQKVAARRGIEKFVPVTTSKVVGSPEPPLPYRTQRLYPKLKTVFPMFIAHQPGSDRLLVITQDAPFSNTTIRRMKDDPEATEYETLLADGRSSYSIEFHPKFLENGYIYVGNNGESAGKDSPKYSRVTRYTIDPKPPYTFDPKSALTIIEWPSDGHNGAAPAFGKDGMLYITSGDGTSDSDTNLRGQEMTHLTAKVLRIDVDHPTADKPYSVPKDNPFLHIPGAAPETWAIGMRNPWRMTCDRETGHLWVGNNGQDLWEQVYLITRGANYGWSVTEGGHPFYPNRQVGPAPIVKPTVEHPHSESRSLTGGIVYYGAKLPELRGAYIYGDHSTGKVWAVKHDGTKILWHKELVDTPFHISGFGTDSHGELVICDHEPGDAGAFYALIPAPVEVAPPKFPTKLSESGLFETVRGHVMQPGVIPYSVNAQLWSDGADKSRFLALPGNEKIDFTQKGPWGLPEKTVIVKSFSLNLEEGNPASKQFIETRFLTKQEGEWIGYSYLWNDEQTDATLVSKEGADREYTIKTSTGERKQAWHYPSRTECMVCHSRAAAYVLGVNTQQLNKDHNYHGVVDNQLRVFEHLRVFKSTNWLEAAKQKIRSELQHRGVKDAEIAKQIEEALKGETMLTAASKLDAISPDRIERFANPYDTTAPINARARAYLASNCAVCHVDAGGGNSQFSLDFSPTLDKLKLVDVAPLHDKFGIADAKLVAAGSPERSVLLHRVAVRGRGQMPQLGTTIVDTEAVKMLTEWIKQVPAPVPEPVVPPKTAAK